VRRRLGAVESGVDIALTVGQFAFCTLLIVLSGVRLSRYGDVIAEKTGMGGTWVGVLLMAAVTSLPELVTGASAVILYDLPEIAAGDVIGSCMFNLLILAFLDFRDPNPLSAHIHQRHTLSAGFGLLLLGLAMLALVAGARAPSIGWIGLHSLVFLAVYVFAMRTIFVFERAHLTDVAEKLTGEIRYADITLRRASALYAASAAVLVAAAIMLPGAAEKLAEETGLGQSFVGSLFVAASTSMPEVVVSIAAARLGALDMAAGNLFGSNIFNIAVLGLDDILYTNGPILA
jgi:cation:H+ antiporter